MMEEVRAKLDERHRLAGLAAVEADQADSTEGPAIEGSLDEKGAV